MRRIGIFLAVVSVLLLALPVVAQEDSGNVAEVVCNKVQPGKNSQFEEGVKKHLDWHRRQNDSWTWVAWQVITGEDTGTYCWGTFGHNWEDFDNPGVPPSCGRHELAGVGSSLQFSLTPSDWQE